MIWLICAFASLLMIAAGFALLIAGWALGAVPVLWVGGWSLWVAVSAWLDEVSG